MQVFRLFLVVMSLFFSLHAKTQVDVNFSNLEINDFIKIVSNISSNNILVTDEISGKVDFISNKPIYDDELMDILSSVLKSKNFALVKNGSVYEVVRLEEAVKYNSNYNINLDDNTMIVTELIKVINNDVDAIASKLQTLISSSSKLVTIKSSNSILLSDYPKNISVIKKIINEIDVKLDSSVFMYEVKYTQAKSLLKYLQESATLLFNPSLQSDSVKILLHEDLNSIIVIGNDKNIKAIEKLIKMFDVKSSNSQTLKIFNLKNSKAIDVFTALEDVLKNQTFNDESLKPNISKSDDINSIIVVGVPYVIKSLEPLIEELDKEKYQVYVEARIIEINKQNSEDLGVKYGFNGTKLLSSGGLLSFSSNFGSKNPIQGVIGNSLSFGYAIDGLALSASLDFLQLKGASHSISNPSLLCVNNKESSIYVGKAISLKNGSLSSSDSGITNSYTRKDVGITLNITPRVSASDKVTLDVSIVLENVVDDGSNNATGQPVTTKQEVKTETILRHGENIIIGGLVKNYSLDSQSKIPLLGDIPLIGKYLFSSTSSTNQQENLVIILTPYILDNSEKLSLLQKDLGTLSHIQEQYNSDVFKNIETNGFKDD